MSGTYPGRNMRQCTECGFWLLGPHAPCANCGRLFPAIDPSSRLQDGLVSLSIAMLVGVGLLLLAGPFGGGHGAPAWAGTMLWLGGSAAAGCGVSAFVLKLLRRAHVPGTLREIEHDIREQLQALNGRLEQIERLRGHLDGAAAADHAVRLLAEGERVLQESRARYDAELLKLRMLRWRNRLGAVLAGRQREGLAAGEQRLRALRAMMSDGAEMLEAARRSEPVSGGESGAVEQLEEDLRSCRLVFDELLNRQVVEAVRDLSPLSSAGPSVPDGRLAEAREVAIRLDRSLSAESFRQSLEQLRYELDRIEAERTLAGWPVAG
jgi:hypothetical protein